MHVGLAHLHVVQAHDGVDLDRVRVGLLAHHLPVDLALGGNVHDEVAEDPRVAAEAPILGQAAAVAVLLLGRAERGQMRGRRRDAVLREGALAHHHLAPPADAAAAADRVEIDPEGPRRVQQVDPRGEASPLARGGEDDERLLGLAHGAAGGSGARAASAVPWAARRRPSRPPRRPLVGPGEASSR